MLHFLNRIIIYHNNIYKQFFFSFLNPEIVYVNETNF